MIKESDWIDIKFCYANGIDEDVSIHIIKDKESSRPLKICNNLHCLRHSNDCNLHRDNPIRYPDGTNYVGI